MDGRPRARRGAYSTGVKVIEEFTRQLRGHAAEYAQVALANIDREFPGDVRQLMRRPGDFPSRPRERNPVFFGSFDWHSCLEMHWLLIRLLRVAADCVPAADIRAVLNRQFTAAGLAAEAEFIADWYHALMQRPYGWGWALALVHETATWDDADARRWADAMGPLAAAVTGNFLGWLPKATYPIRPGIHGNSAFGLSRALPYARARAQAGAPQLADAIVLSAQRWFGEDAGYPGEWEPSGADFLSPALSEAELMSAILPPQRFASWLDAFLPDIAGHRPAALFTPAVVSDPGDGYIAHLHGLNATRAWCWRRLAEALPEGDLRIGPALTAAKSHAEAALPHVAGDDYMVEHFLACYAVLMLS